MVSTLIRRVSFADRRTACSGKADRRQAERGIWRIALLDGAASIQGQNHHHRRATASLHPEYVLPLRAPWRP